MRLPDDKKLVAVKYTYEDGSVFTLNEENALNFQNNIKSTSILSVRGNHYFAPVDWELKNEKNEIVLLEEKLEAEAKLITEAVSDVVVISKLNDEDSAKEIIKKQFVVINRQDLE